MGLNPSAAKNLKFCTDAQLGKGKAIGDLSRITTPPASTRRRSAARRPRKSAPSRSKPRCCRRARCPAPSTSASSSAATRSRARSTGSSSTPNRPRYGVYVRLIGEVIADPTTGRLTARFDDPAHGGLPQVPFSSFSLQFDGAKGVLTSPPTCGPNTTTSTIHRLGRQRRRDPVGRFTLTNAPGGGACAKTMAERPFGPASTRNRLRHAARLHLLRRRSRAPTAAGAERRRTSTLPAGRDGEARRRPVLHRQRHRRRRRPPGANEQKNPSCPAAARSASPRSKPAAGPRRSDRRQGLSGRSI